MFLILLVISVAVSVFSFYPQTSTEISTQIIIDDTFNLAEHEIYRQGLGSFRGNEIITLHVKGTAEHPIDFSLITYTGQQYTALAKSFNYTFVAAVDYYEVVFEGNPISSNTVTLQASVQTPTVAYPLSWLIDPARMLFIFSWSALIILLSLPELKKSSKLLRNTHLPSPALSLKNKRLITFLVVLSLAFWITLLIFNSYPLGTFEDWYTDHARHPYSANLFTKVGFSIFDTPLGFLSSSDDSMYKFVTWPQMPHLYPIGSIFLFLPFGILLEAGVAQTLTFKLEIALLLAVSHVGLYYFLERFWSQNANSLLKIASIYLFYVVLILYSANGQFDAIAFLFALFGSVMFLEKRYDIFLLFLSLATAFKYQAGIFLAPLALIGVIRLFRGSSPSMILKNKAVLAAFSIVAFNLFTAYLSIPYLTRVRPEFVMNGVNAFSPHGQISWVLQAFTVFLFLSVTLVFVTQIFNQNRSMVLFAVFMLMPCLTMPYFQSWYFPFLFIYLLLPRHKSVVNSTLIWLIFVVLILSFGGLSYNPLAIIDRIRNLLVFSPNFIIV